MSGTQRRMARDFKANSPGVNRSDRPESGAPGERG